MKLTTLLTVEFIIVRFFLHVEYKYYINTVCMPKSLHINNNYYYILVLNKITCIYRQYCEQHQCVGTMVLNRC